MNKKEKENMEFDQEISNISNSYNTILKTTADIARSAALSSVDFSNTINTANQMISNSLRESTKFLFESINKSISAIMSSFDISNFVEIEVEVVKSKEGLQRFLKEIGEEYSNCFYRGEEDSSWKHIPPILRHALPESDEDNIVDIEEFYKKCNEKYHMLFDNIEGDYNKYSYLQHSTVPTMLMDYTRNPYIALSFALNKSNYKKKDLAFYVLTIEDEDDIIYERAEADKVLEKYRIEFVDMDRELPDNYNLRIIDIPTNDRMMYQQGVFLLSEVDYSPGFIEDEEDKCLIDKWLDGMRQKGLIYNFDIKKYVIKSKFIMELSNIIDFEYPQYTRENLMDPYKFLKEE